MEISLSYHCSLWLFPLPLFFSLPPAPPPRCNHSTVRMYGHRPAFIFVDHHSKLNIPKAMKRWVTLWTEAREPLPVKIWDRSESANRVSYLTHMDVMLDGSPLLAACKHGGHRFSAPFSGYPNTRSCATPSGILFFCFALYRCFTRSRQITQSIPTRRNTQLSGTVLDLFPFMKKAQALLHATKDAEQLLGCSLTDPRVSEQSTLNTDVWRQRAAVLETALTNALETYREDVEALASPAMLLVLEKYNRVQQARCTMVPLTEDEWHTWWRITETLVTRAVEALKTADGATEGTSTLSSQDQLRESEARRRSFLAVYTSMWSDYDKSMWGTLEHSQLTRRMYASFLNSAVANTKAPVLAALLSTSKSTPSSDKGAEAKFLEVCEPVLQRHTTVTFFEAACLDPVGQEPTEELLRENYLEPLSVMLDELAEDHASELDNGSVEKLRTLVEGWTRQSFRRQLALDFDTPQETIAAQYADFEADEKRADSMKHFITQTRSGVFHAYQTAKAALQEFYAKEQSLGSSSHTGSAEFLRKEEALLVDLLKATEAMRPVDGLPLTSSLSAFRCFALCAHQLVGRSVFPAPVPPVHLEKLLSYLQTWFSKYLGSQHRWSWQFPFHKDDDEDLWAFLLDRHEVVLCHGASRSAPSVSAANGEFLSQCAGQWSVIRTVTLSAVHAWQTYLSLQGAEQTRANPEKRRARAAQATDALSVWFNDIIVQHFAKAFMTDVYDAMDARSLSWEEETVAVALEAQVKMFICDVLLAMGASYSPVRRRAVMLESRKRLRSVTDAVRELLESRPATAASQIEDTTPATASCRSVPDGELRLIVVYEELLGRLHATTAARNVVHTIRGDGTGVLTGDLQDDDSLPFRESGERELLRFLLDGYKHLAKLTVAMGCPEPLCHRALSRLQQLMLEYPVFTEERTTSDGPFSQPVCLPLYSDPLVVNKKGGSHERIPLGGVLDLACQALALRRELPQTDPAQSSNRKRPRDA